MPALPKCFDKIEMLMRLAGAKKRVSMLLYGFLPQRAKRADAAGALRRNGRFPADRSERQSENVLWRTQGCC